MPLLIGGATTSRVHTAVKIDPNYTRGQTVYVTDASRAVGVVSSLLSNDNKGALRRRRAARICRHRPTAIAAATSGSRRLTHRRRRAPTGRSPTGRPTRRRSRSSSACASSTTTIWARWFRYIDWAPFFRTWEMKGRYPDLLERSEGRRGGARAVRRRASDAEDDRRRALAHGDARRSASGRRNADGDDIVLFSDDEPRRGDRDVPHAAPAGGARTRHAQPGARRFRGAADTGKADYIGGFVVTTGHGETRNRSDASRPTRTITTPSC